MTKPGKMKTRREHMFVSYARELLRAEEGLTEKEKIRLAESIERWAQRHDIQDIGRIHEVLDDWIDYSLKRNRRRVLHLDYPVGDDADFMDLLENPRAQNPAEIVIADGKLKRTDQEEAREYIEKNLDGDARELLVGVLDQAPDSNYTIDAGSQVICERAAIIKTRVREGKLLIPKKTVSIRFENGKLKIEYLRGFSDERVNRALRLYSKGLYPRQIAEKMGMKEATISDWLYSRMDLPRIGKEIELRRHDKYKKRILELYDKGSRPAEIVAQLDCGNATVYRILKRYKGLVFGGGGPDPWVYGFTGNVPVLHEFRELDLEMEKITVRGSRIYDCRENYELVFKYVRSFCRQNNRPPTGDEVQEALGFKSYHYLQDMVRLGVLSKKKIPKEKLYTPGLL